MADGRGRHGEGGTGSGAGSGSSCATLLATVQAANLWEGDNSAGRGLTLLKSPTGHGIGLPTKRAADAS